MRSDHGYLQLFQPLLTAVLIAFSASVPAEPLLIGVEDDWFPYAAFKDGIVQGMSVDIVKAAFAATETQIELRPYPYPRCISMVQQGKLLACFNTAHNAQVASNHLLPKMPLFSEDVLLWARAAQAPQVTDVYAALKGKRVAVTIGYEYGTRFDTNQQVLRVPVRKDLYGFLMLQKQRVDYSVAYRGTAEQLFRDHPELAGKFTAVATIDQPQLFLSFSRHNPAAPAVVKRFEQGMQLIHDNGRYQQIIQQWQPSTTQ